MNNNFDDIVLNRRSVKVFDENYKIPRDEMLEILKEASLAPSSLNMQPYRFVVVDTKEGKDKLRNFVTFNTRQNDTSSAMIIVFYDFKPEEKLEEIYGGAVEKGYMPQNIKETMVNMIKQAYESYSKEDINNVNRFDCGLVSMQLMLVARKYGYETNPIGGFTSKGLAKAFDLDEERYIPTIMIAIGKKNYEVHNSYRLDINTITNFK